MLFFSTAGEEHKERLLDVIDFLNQKGSSSSPQAEFIVRVMCKWAGENNLQVV
jgi:hypothetical protein